MRSPRDAAAGLWLATVLACAGCAPVAYGLRSSVPQDKGENRVQAPPVPAAAPRAALHARLTLLASRHGICHADLAVIRHRELQSVDAGYGCAGDAYAAANQEHVFQAASLGKPLFAYAVLKLVQQGKMDLDAPVLDYLPRGYAHRQVAYLADSAIDQVTDPALPAVTVRMALNHTAGLPGWSNGPLAFDARPGARWQYSGEGYLLLQRAMEEVTGEPFGAFMQRTVFGPLGMTHSAYTREARLEPYIVPGTNDQGPTLTLPPFREPVAAFTLYTSARDYGRFLSALLKDERSLRQIAASPVPVSPRLGLDWGSGWGLERHQGDVFLWHWGNNPGYRAFAMVSPRSGDGFVMFTNSESGMALARPISEEVFGVSHPVFQYHLLRDGLDNLLCEMLDACR
ncbi:MAG TPA: serine hydrolase domain-containing protein [Pseudoduganella sp.]